MRASLYVCVEGPVDSSRPATTTTADDGDGVGDASAVNVPMTLSTPADRMNAADTAADVRTTGTSAVRFLTRALVLLCGCRYWRR